ncbi:unnamed protein product [Linum trigynum]|uniref:FCP1 homology domain-containing protein n=1 Tax=Linum trigynum TaxID=586398 RepID=A0AAV2GQT4_9ROSI
MSKENDACITTYIVETQSTIKRECSQLKKKRKKKQLKRSWDASGDSLPNDFLPENACGRKGSCINEAGVDANSNESFERTNDIQSVTLLEEMKKPKKHKKGLNNLQPAIFHKSQEEGQLEKAGNVSSDSLADISAIENGSAESVVYVNPVEVGAQSNIDSITTGELITLSEVVKRRKKKKKKDLNSPRPAKLVTSKDEKQVEMIQKFSSDSQAGISSTENNVDGTVSHVNEDNIDAKSEKDLMTTQATEPANFQEGGKKKKKRKKGVNSSQPAELLSQNSGCHENAHKIGIDQDIISATENATNEKDSYVDEVQVDNNSRNGLSNLEAEELGTCQEGEKKKKRKKARDSSQPTKLISSQVEGQLEKIENSSSYSQLEISGTKNTIREAGKHVDDAEVDATPKIDLSATHATESATLHKEGKGKKKRGDSSNPHSSELIASQEEGAFESMQNVGSDPQADLSETKNISISKNSCIHDTGIDANPTEDLNRSQSIMLVELQEGGKKRKKKQEKHLNCSHPMQLPTSDEEGKTKKKRKKDSSSSGPREMHESHEERVAAKMICLKNDTCLDNCLKENIPEVRKVKKKQKLMAKDGIITAEGKEGGHADDAINTSVEAKDNIGVIQAGIGSLIHATDVLTDKDDFGEPGSLSVELTHANEILNKDEVRLSSMKSIKYGGPTEPGTERITGDEKPQRGHSDEKHPNKHMEDVLIGEQAREHSPLIKPDILTGSASFNCSKEVAICEELERTSERGNEVTGQSSENCSNCNNSGEHSTSVKGLEMTIGKKAESNFSDIDISLEESKMPTKIMNEVNVDVPTERGSIPRAPKIPMKGPPNAGAAKKLLILDVNGLLADIIPHSQRPTSRKPDFHLRQKSVYRRPYCVDFLNFCFKYFEVGVWSSRKRVNLDEVVKFLFGSSKRDLLFCWDRSFCTIVGVATIDNPEKPLVLKELQRLWGDWKKCPWRRGYFDASNTLLLDDSPYKALRNPVHTAIFPHSYKCTDDEDSALGPEGDIRRYLERLIEAPHVQEFVSQNPFGQNPIRASDPSWPFYRKIIIGGN